MVKVFVLPDFMTFDSLNIPFLVKYTLYPFLTVTLVWMTVEYVPLPFDMVYPLVAASDILSACTNCVGMDPTARVTAVITAIFS